MAGIQDSLRRLQESIKGLSDASALVGASSTASNASENSARGIISASSSSSRQKQLDHQHPHLAQTRHIFQNDMMVEQRREANEASRHANYYGPHDPHRHLAGRDEDTRRQQLPAAAAVAGGGGRNNPGGTGAGDGSCSRSSRSSKNSDDGKSNGDDNSGGAAGRDNISNRRFDGGRGGSPFRQQEQIGRSGVGFGTAAAGPFLSASDGLIMAESAEVGSGGGKFSCLCSGCSL